MEAVSPLVCLTLDRATFTAVLGPLQQLMSREKSAAVVTQRLMRLQSRGGPSRVPAEVLVRRQRRSRSKGTDVWEVVRARGHLDEVLELRGGQGGAAQPAEPAGAASGAASGAAAAAAQLVLTEGSVLGGGAFSRVSVVCEQTTGRAYALKRMRKSGVVQCPEHVFCEQTITRNLTHPFCIRQYASFQVRAAAPAGWFQPNHGKLLPKRCMQPACWPGALSLSVGDPAQQAQKLASVSFEECGPALLALPHPTSPTASALHAVPKDKHRGFLTARASSVLPPCRRTSTTCTSCLTS